MTRGVFDFDLGFLEVLLPVPVLVLVPAAARFLFLVVVAEEEVETEAVVGEVVVVAAVVAGTVEGGGTVSAKETATESFKAGSTRVAAAADASGSSIVSIGAQCFDVVVADSVEILLLAYWVDILIAAREEKRERDKR